MSFPFVELETVADVNWGNTSITKKSYVEEGFSAFSAAGNDGLLPDFQFNEQGIVLSAIGARCGKCFKANGKWTAIKNTITIIPNEENKADIDYLFYYLNRENIWPNKGGAQPFISLKAAKSLKIPLPPLPVQKQIAAVLEKADTLRGQCQQMEQELNTLAQSVFLDMFGDPVKNSKKYHSKKLAQLIDQERGISYGIVQRGNDFSNGVPVVRISNFTRNEFTNENIVVCDPLISQKYSRTVLKGGELLISIRGTVGRVAIVPDSAAGYNVSREVAIIPILDDVNSMFLKLLLLTASIQREILGQVKGVAQSGINLKDLRELEIILPPCNEIERFVSVINNLESRKQNIKELRLKVHENFNSLMQRAFKGELNIKDVA